MKACELCGADSSLHCEADDAFLCWACDARVHAANFLVARHLRTLACSSCRSLLHPLRTVSGPAPAPTRSLCPSCRERRREAVLANWSRRMGLRDRRRCVAAAKGFMRSRSLASTALPFRVCAAAALWFAMRAVEGRSGRAVLRRLEACSGVPAKVIVLVGSPRVNRFAERINRAGSEG